jgi:FkbM family methyltransferase
MTTVVFKNDDDVSIILPEHRFSGQFATRDNHEVLFRRINTYLIKRKIIKGNIIDLGAWMGDNSIPWAKNIEGVVYAIDPSPNNCNFIKQVCELNSISNIITLEEAISNTEELLSTNQSIDHCSFVYGNPGVRGQIKKTAVSLDILFDRKKIENIGYIHLDVEGMEYKILQGSSKIIDESRPIITFEQHLEIDDYNLILSYLTEKGYKVFLINEILPGCRHDCRNSFAFPNEIYTESLIDDIHANIGVSVLIPK